MSYEATPASEFHFEGLPGAALIHEGLKDLAAGKDSVPALLVQIGRPRLMRLGFSIPANSSEPEHDLYRMLAILEPDSAHSRYNALIRTLVSFERAAECAG